MGAFRGSRWITWILGMLSFLTAVVTAFTGYASLQDFEAQCKEWNMLEAFNTGLSGVSYDNTLTLSAHEWRHVKFIELFEEIPLLPAPLKPTANFDDFNIMQLLDEPKLGQWLMMSDSCKHCVAAPCHEACPTGAIVHAEFGNVFIQPDICNG